LQTAASSGLFACMSRICENGANVYHDKEG
jgi:hypothetical protein